MALALHVVGMDGHPVDMPDRLLRLREFLLEPLDLALAALQPGHLVAVIGAEGEARHDGAAVLQLALEPIPLGLRVLGALQHGEGEGGESARIVAPDGSDLP